MEKLRREEKSGEEAAVGAAAGLHLDNTPIRHYPRRPANPSNGTGMVKRFPSAAVEPPRRLPKVWQTESGPHKRVPFPLAVHADTAQRERALARLVSDVSSALAEAVDELRTYDTEFRTGLDRAWRYVLQRAAAQSEPVLFFNEAIPGFTLMMFKKDAGGVLSSGWEGGSETDTSPPCDTPEAAAAGAVIDQFVGRTGARVMVVEGDDVLFVFFPVTDLKKNLKEMGFYLTE